MRYDNVKLYHPVELKKKIVLQLEIDKKNSGGSKGVARRQATTPKQNLKNCSAKMFIRRTSVPHNSPQGGEMSSRYHSTNLLGFWTNRYRKERPLDTRQRF